MKNVYITDRTTIETDEDCGMRRWWYKHAEGTGIVPLMEPVYYRQGREIHAALASIAEGEDLDEVLSRAPFPVGGNQEDQEAWSRHVGWVVAFHDFVWPLLQKLGYTFVMVEKEMILDRTPLWTAFTADLVLRRRDGRLVVIDFKTVGMLGRGWYEHWEYAMQLHINAIGIAEELGEPVAHAWVIGLRKGDQRDGKQRHPYTWAYSDGEGGWQKDWKYGWSLRPVWEFGSGGVEGVKEWVRLLGQGVAMEQFPFSAPVIPDLDFVNRVAAKTLRREAMVRDVLVGATHNMDTRLEHFEQRTSKCRPVVGAACPYLEACWNPVVGQDPIGSGLYVKRTPHHDVELEGEQE